MKLFYLYTEGEIPISTTFFDFFILGAYSPAKNFNFQKNHDPIGDVLINQ